MFKYLILSIVITILICLIYFVFFSDNSKRVRSEKLLNESSGVFDASARLALEELTQIRDPTPGDHFRRGNIYHYNILGGELRRNRRDRHIIVENIVREYTDAIVGMRGRIREIGNDRIGPDFIVHRIEDLNWHLLAGADEDEEIQQILFGFNNTVTNYAPTVRKEIVEERVARAVSSSTSRAEAIDKYFDASARITSDSQNVHDSKVNNDLRGTLRRLKLAAPDIDTGRSIEEIREYIQGEFANSSNRDKVNNALITLDKMSNGEVIGTFGESEDRILAYTWERCKDRRNRDNADLMREAVVIALADCIENGNQVCINGRCGRILNSLVTLDFDKEVAGGVMTFEAYKNQIFQETKTIISEEIIRAKSSPDSQLRAVGESYDGADIEVNPDVEERFKRDIKEQIDRNIAKYEDKLTSSEINNLKQECYIYATI